MSQERGRQGRGASLEKKRSHEEFGPGIVYLYVNFSAKESLRKGGVKDRESGAERESGICLSGH